MLSLDKLENMLQTQFGPYIREERYRKAFDRAMLSLRNMPPEVSQIDVFYLFMHRLILDLFTEIDLIQKQLEECKDNHR